MRTIYKYPIPFAPEVIVGTFSGALFRHFGHQDGKLYVWLEVRTYNVADTRSYAVVGTGHKVPRGAEYRGTTQVGEFVWHLYEL